MPTKPKIRTLTNSSVDILNAIRNGASVDYREYVPVATADAESLRTIGAVIMDNPSLQNEFINALINRIGLVLITSKLYRNPLAMFKKGKLDFGETIEEIFVNLAKAHTFDSDKAETNVFKKEKPDVRSAFHIMNYQKYYKTSISEDQLRQAFLSWEGIGNLVTKAIEALYTGANYDEFQTMKYMVAKKIMEGRMYPETIPAISDGNAKKIVTAIKGFSNNLEFLSNKYNTAGVYNATPKNEQYLLVNSKFDSLIDVEVLASAFNMSKAEFMGHRVLVDGFGQLDIARLNELFADDPTYTEFSEDELAALDEIPAILVDGDWFMIYDNLDTMRTMDNGEGLYRNYWYHVWKTFSVSPFANGCVFVPATPTVDTITLSPAESTMAAGTTLALTTTVATTNFAPQTVSYISDTEGVTVSASGIVTIGKDVPSETTITITAKSTFDTDVTGTATITVA